MRMSWSRVFDEPRLTVSALGSSRHLARVRPTPAPDHSLATCHAVSHSPVFLSLVNARVWVEGLSWSDEVHVAGRVRVDVKDVTTRSGKEYLELRKCLANGR
jgi:hypothetical protein